MDSATPKDIIYKDGMNDTVAAPVATTTNGNIKAVIADVPAIMEPKEDGRLESLLSRKFILSVIVLLLSTWVFSTGSISVGDWMTLVLLTTGGYLGANVVQKFS
jgi:hypothetical protein